MPAPLTRQRPRTCVACRTEAPKRALIRVVRTPDGSAVLDVTGRLPGRGAYLCLNVECLHKARRTGALSRALKTSLTDACWEELERCIEHCAKEYGPEERTRELRSLLGLSRRGRLLFIGMDAIRAEAGRGKPLLLLTARDCSEAVGKFAEGLASEGHQHMELPLDIEALSAALGAGSVQAAALAARSGLADKLRILLAE
ncbi:MAG: DUF448 domain-containing protein [Fretibacterium sp.]|nr:DUF448 domain-containing protein [Fretibacterium sp.]